ncbi:MAG TPA: cbb3-type cytochrome c oxidase N-terminal domain-containing protein [Chondromyces sp.]|nr:cbb3-type cytochrome c oxidase N-terminal domain-containing protein [Chondromyces sp.]
MSTERNGHPPAVPEEDHLLDHSYDGIQEYDNPLPSWWLAIFWITIVFTPLYILYYHYGGGALPEEKYDEEMIAFFDRQAEELQALGEITETTLAGLTDDASMMNSGKKIFQSKCATCHGMFGEGGIGPNLTDRYWLHGAQLTDIYRTVREGVTDKGMLAWERQLRPAELMAVSAYAGSLLGSEPPNAKEPQGERIARLPPSELDDADSEASGDDAGAETEPAAS